MLPDYKDITSRIPEPPKWHDSHGVPRYSEFHPDLVPNIYAKEAVLYLIACQACGQEFQVAEQSSPFDEYLASLSAPGNISLSERAKLGRLHYGDPPRHECVGDTMNCDDVKTLQFWQQERFDWARVPALEGVSLEEHEWMFEGASPASEAGDDNGS